MTVLDAVPTCRKPSIPEQGWSFGRTLRARSFVRRKTSIAADLHPFLKQALGYRFASALHHARLSSPETSTSATQHSMADGWRRCSYSPVSTPGHGRPLRAESSCARRIPCSLLPYSTAPTTWSSTQTNPRSVVDATGSIATVYEQRCLAHVRGSLACPTFQSGDRQPTFVFFAAGSFLIRFSACTTVFSFPFTLACIVLTEHGFPVQLACSRCGDRSDRSTRPTCWRSTLRLRRDTWGPTSNWAAMAWARAVCW